MSEPLVTLPEVEVNTFRKSNPLEAEVIENRSLFATYDQENDARHIILHAPGMNYLEGQSIGVLTPGVNEKNKPHAVRLYSVASVGSDLNPGDQKDVALCVKRLVYIDEADGEKKYGVASNYLCDLKVGDRLQITGPAGRKFLLPTQSEMNRPYLFFATGTGIAPFRGMLHRLLKQKSPLEKQIYLFFGVKREGELMYGEEFKGYQNFSNFHYRTACSREQKNARGDKLYLHHLIGAEKEEISALLKNPGTLIYICGTKGMEKGVLEELAATLHLTSESEEFQGLVEGRVFLEVY